jgi:DEAD/DEAH box helicase domain-containing protein
LRNGGPDRFSLILNNSVIGEVDDKSVYWLAHPNAVYIQDGESYFVENVDTKTHIVHLSRFTEGYYTQPQSVTEIECLAENKHKTVSGGSAHYGKLQVTNQVTGYKKLKWYSHEILGYGDLDLPPTELITFGYWLAVSDESVKYLEKMGHWRNKQNDYGSQWPEITKTVRARDGYFCTACGIAETDRIHDVHHVVPFKRFESAREANDLKNLVTLCVSCHRKAEQQARIQSGMSGLAYVIGNLAPFFLMCDAKDIGVQGSSKASVADGNPAVILYDMVAGGIGLSDKLYDIQDTLLAEAQSIVSKCSCKDGCPACVGPVAENGSGAKEETLALLNLFLNKG